MKKMRKAYSGDIMKIVPAIVSAAIVLVALWAVTYYLSVVPAAPTSFSFDNKTYQFTYVATTLAQQEAGLMNKTVTNTTFELFVMPGVSIYPFWMKDTYYPLDIIWVNGTTVSYIADAVPCSSYSPDQSNCTIYDSYNEGHYANYVIEAQAGFTNRTGLKVGDRISFG